MKLSVHKTISEYKVNDINNNVVGSVRLIETDPLNREVIVDIRNATLSHDNAEKVALKIIEFAERADRWNIGDY